MKQDDSKYVLKFKDADGKEYVFYRKNYRKHTKRHRELEEEGYLEQVKELICECEPDMIYRSYYVKNAYVYYDELAKTDQGTWYNMAVVKKFGNVYHIATAWRFCGDIREKKYYSSLKKRP